MLFHHILLLLGVVQTCHHYHKHTQRTLGGAVPDLGLWRPLGNNVIEKSSTTWAYQLNDCKNMHMLQFKCKGMYNCVTNSNNTLYLSYCLQTRHVSTFASSKVSDEIYVFKFWKWLLPVSLYINGVFRIIEELIRIVNKLRSSLLKRCSVSSW